MIVNARISVRPQDADEFRRKVNELAKNVRREDGCMAYELHEALEDSGKFAFVEEWASEESFKAHLQSPAMAGFGAKLGHLIAGDTEMTTWKRTSAADG